MVFTPESNSTLGLTGMITTGSLLLVICVSLIIIVWDTCRSAPARRRSLYMDFEPALAELYSSSNHDVLYAKKGIVCYGLAIFCQFVISHNNVTNS